MKKKVLILYTGGTIGMQATKQGFAPAPGLLAHCLQKSLQLQHDLIPEFTIKEYASLIDSSNMRPTNWMQIARDIYQSYHDYDGFIVLHGTDTMAYTASALSFMLRDLGKPVICTGAQIAIGELRTDAIKHILDSLLLIVEYNVPEVCIYFDNVLLRGNRAKKMHVDNIHAFSSLNYPALANIGTHITLHQYLLRPMPSRDIKMLGFKTPLIATMKLFPGINAKILQAMLSQNLDGLIINTYGSGNAPDDDNQLMSVIRQATDTGTVIVNITQCSYGSVDMTSYATGNILADNGVISGFDMTYEAALTKLYYLFSADLSIDKIKTKMQENLRGELTLAKS